MHKSMPPYKTKDMNLLLSTFHPKKEVTHSLKVLKMYTVMFKLGSEGPGITPTTSLGKLK